MKTKIIRENCIACGNCNAICPEIEAYENCPTEAIFIENGKEKGENIE